MLPLDDVLNPPLLTRDLPGIGGKIKAAPEDFDVEEIPAYEPCGEGDFLYLWIEKRGMGAEYFTRQIARRLSIRDRDVGVAGLKDRHAVTRQMISVPAAAEPNLPRLERDGIKVLRISRHTNKLRPGHLHGNRFRILVRAPASLDPAAIGALLERVRQFGLPNYYGNQRFGHGGGNVDMGLSVMRGESGSRPIERFATKFVLSAVQSALFNHCLAQRQRDGLLHRVLAGDVMCKVPFGGMFVAADVPTEQQRFDAREIVSAGPIFGRKMFAAAQDAAQREAMVLEAFALTPASFHGFGKLILGTRRHNLVYLDDLAADAEPEGWRLKFTLPAGAYATILLREIMKSDLPAEDLDEDP